MNPWDIVWPLLGWGVLLFIALVLGVVTAGVIIGVVDRIRASRRPKRRATYIFPAREDSDD